VGGERFGFSRCEAAGVDETEQKHLLRIFAAATLKKEFVENFCEVEDAECFGGFAVVQTYRNTQSRIELLYYHEASGLASVERSPRPQVRQAMPSPAAKPAPVGGALVH